jgi:hypothetical protein
MTERSTWRRAAIFVAALGSTSCGGDSTPDPVVAVPVPTRVEISSLTALTAAVGTTIVDHAPRVKVLDSRGNPVAGFPVSFAVVTGAGTLGAIADTTGPDGVARSGSWTLGNVPGLNVVKATAEGLAGSPVTFEATAQPGPVTSIQPMSAVTQPGLVNTLVAEVPVVQVRDAFGNPIAGVSVTFEPSSTGTVGSPVVVTDQAGMASAVSWKLGTAAGTQALRARVQDRDFRFFATAQAGPAVRLDIYRQPTQSYTTKKITFPPAVGAVDQFGNRVNVNTMVTVQMTSASVALSGTTSVPLDGEFVEFTDLTVTGLGDATLSFSAPGLGSVSSAVFTVRKPASRLKITQQPVAQELGYILEKGAGVIVVDEDDQLVPLDVPMQMVVTRSDGAIVSSLETIANGGMASFGVTLETAGAFTMSITSPGLTGVTTQPFSPRPPTPTGALVVSGDRQAAVAGVPVARRPTVRVVNPVNFPVAGATVTFTARSGGGSVTGETVITDSSGRATVGGWALGPGINTLRATVNGYPDAVPGDFTAVGCEGAGAGFRITLCVTSAVNATTMTAFRNAAARWDAVIADDLADVPLQADSLRAGECGEGSFMLPPGTVIDDVLIFASLVSMDGPGGTLAAAGPCLVRQAGSQLAVGDLPVVGAVLVDVADVGSLGGERLTATATHEIGHVLGIGTLWNAFGLLRLPSLTSVSLDTHFAGENARVGFNAIGGQGYASARVPVENDVAAGPGTVNAHWRETVFDDELMTGYLDLDKTVFPLSEVTVRSLADLGYTVNVSAADPFSLTVASAAAAAGGARVRSLRRFDDRLEVPIRGISRSGRIRRFPPS